MSYINNMIILKVLISYEATAENVVMCREGRGMVQEPSPNTN